MADLKGIHESALLNDTGTPWREPGKVKFALKQKKVFERRIGAQHEACALITKSTVHDPDNLMLFKMQYLT